MAISGVHQDISDTRNIVSDTHNIVSEIRRAMVKHQQGSGDGALPVNHNYAPLASG